MIEPLGSDTLVFFSSPTGDGGAPAAGLRRSPRAQRFTVYPDLARMHLFDAATGRAL